jgi:3'-5' exoribonuclease
MEKMYIQDLKFKEPIETLFLVKFINVMQARDGSEYLNVILSDKTGDLEARAWNSAQEIAANVARGDYVKASGKLNLYQNRKQFIISSIERVEEDSVDIKDYVVTSGQDPEKMFQELMGVVNDLDDVYIKELLVQILSEKEIQRRLKLWPAGKTIHHAYQSGLLEHVLSCTHLSLSLSKHYKVNHNYVVAGAILHDLCKIYELSDGPTVDYTEEGKLVGHLVKGPELIERYSYRIPNFPRDLKNHLKHILLSHHGELAYGSPKVPQTMEAYLVHLVDYMDSKMNAMQSVIEQDQTPGHWSGFVKHLERIVYKKPLPHYTEFLSEKNVKKKERKADLKQNLGKLLEGFEVKE